MIPGYDRKVNPDWPFVADDQTERARKLAAGYRSALAAADPEAAAAQDALARRFGETWLFEAEDLIDDSEALTTAEAAAIAGIAVGTLRNWACLPNPEEPDEKLLPRFGKRGQETTYLAGAVRRAVEVVRRQQHARTHFP